MKKIKKKNLLIFFLPLVIGVSVFSIFLINKKNTVGMKYEFVVDMKEKNYRKVYLLDENKYLIPLSIDVSSKEYLVDEIYTVVSNLRDLEVEGFTQTLPSEVKINKIELENGILNIDFSKEFLVYQSELEEKMIESLTWSVLDFKEVKGLTISVDGVKLTKMPLNGLTLPSVLNKEIGINKYHDMMNDFKDSEDVILLYEKEIKGVTYYVPITRKVTKDSNTTSTIVNALDTKIAIMSGLSTIETLANFSNKNIEYNEMSVSITLNEDYLIEDNIIDKELYEILMVTFEYNDISSKVNFIINDESVMVNGYLDSEDNEVSNIVFNEIGV